MNWDDLRIIAAVRNNGTFAGAAGELGIDETTVSRRLSRIQDALGVTLFDAVDGARKPTPHGDAMLVHIDEISRRVKKIAAVGDRATGPTGNIRVASTHSIAEDFLAPHLAGFLAANPGISLELKISNENVNFSRWEADLAIRLGKPARGAFIIQKLAEVRLYLIGPREDTDAASDCIVCGYPEELGDTPEMRHIELAELTDRIRLRTGNPRIIRAVIQAHAGVGILPEYLARDFLDDPRLTVTPLQAHRQIWLLIQPHLQNDPAARLTIDWIKNRLSIR